MNPEYSLKKCQQNPCNERSKGSVFTAAGALTTLSLSIWDKMSFHVGSTSSLVVKTTQLSLWLKLVWTLKRNSFLRKKNLQRISAFFSHGNPNEQSLPCIPMSTNWLKNWNKHLLVMQVMAIRSQTHHTLSQTHKNSTGGLMCFCTFALSRVGSAVKLITK